MEAHVNVKLKWLLLWSLSGMTRTTEWSEELDEHLPPIEETDLGMCSKERLQHVSSSHFTFACLLFLTATSRYLDTLALVFWWPPWLTCGNWVAVTIPQHGLWLGPCWIVIVQKKKIKHSNNRQTHIFTHPGVLLLFVYFSQECSLHALSSF